MTSLWYDARSSRVASSSTRKGGTVTVFFLCFEPKALNECADSQFGRTIDGDDALYGNGDAADDILRILSETLS